MASTKEQVWLSEYFTCFNATEAARRAGYKWPGRQGAEKKAKFAAEIQARLDELTMTADEALYHLSMIARADIGDYVVDSGLDVERMKADGLGFLIKGAKRMVTQFDDRLEIEIHDRLSAIDKILRAQGAYKDNVDVTSLGQRIAPIAFIAEERPKRDDD